MNLMKRLTALAIALTLALTFALTACGVPQEEYDKLSRDYDRLRDDYNELRSNKVSRRESSNISSDLTAVDSIVKALKVAAVDPVNNASGSVTVGWEPNSGVMTLWSGDYNDRFRSAFYSVFDSEPFPAKSDSVNSYSAVIVTVKVSDGSTSILLMSSPPTEGGLYEFAQGLSAIGTVEFGYW
jgi:hypothetical protein